MPGLIFAALPTGTFPRTAAQHYLVLVSLIATVDYSPYGI